MPREGDTAIVEKTFDHPNISVKLATRFDREQKKSERGTFLGVTARAVWDGVRRNYTRTHPQVLALSKT